MNCTVRMLFGWFRYLLNSVIQGIDLFIFCTYLFLSYSLFLPFFCLQLVGCGVATYHYEYYALWLGKVAYQLPLTTCFMKSWFRKILGRNFLMVWRGKWLVGREGVRAMKSGIWYSYLKELGLAVVGVGKWKRKMKRSSSEPFQILHVIP